MRNKGKNKVHYDISLLSDSDIRLFREGSLFRLYEKLGSHLMKADGVEGACFAVWAPNAKEVSVTGDFNGWDEKSHRLKARGDESGIWEGFVPGVGKGSLYKYHIVSMQKNYKVDKGDPFAFRWETPPKTSSIVWDLDYDWNDSGWMKERMKKNSLDSPISIYEAHLGSWRRKGKGDKHLTYRELGDKLADYVREMGFTHVEFMPVMEHPFYGSWGYQVTGFFAPTSRYGEPQDFMYLVDCLHQKGIGIILDWVPSHFPDDEHGLALFDGTYLYENPDPKRRVHPDWDSLVFNYGRGEVKSFLISSALFWLEKYHVDGIRIDAVASMLYLDYSRKKGEWEPNEFGGRENIEAISFLKEFNQAVYDEFPDVQTIAEESTAWPMVTKPTHLGGLGFGMKWMMGWMNDILQYMSKAPVHRKFHHNQLTFSIMYAFSENFLLPLSHDEVVHGKSSLLHKMPEDDWRKFANLRLLYGCMFAHPGKKLMFMGGEFGQRSEWNHDGSLEWDLLQYEPHEGLKRWVKELNIFYKKEPALHELDFKREGFEWIDANDSEQSTLSFLRRGKTKKEIMLVVCNFTPKPRLEYNVGVPHEGFWKEMLNSDAKEYGGSGHGNFGGLEAESVACHGREYSLNITLPPLGILFFKKEAE